MKRKQKLVTVPIKLDGDIYATMQALAKLSGRSVEVVVSVMIALGILEHTRRMRVGIDALAAEQRKRRA